MMQKLKPSFDEYEVEPSPEVWGKIVTRLDSTSEKTTGWLYYGIGAVLLTGFILFFTLFYDVEVTVKPKQKVMDGSPASNSGNELVKQDKQSEKKLSDPVSVHPGISGSIDKVQENNSTQKKQDRMLKADVITPQKRGASIRTAGDLHASLATNKKETNARKEETWSDSITLIERPFIEKIRLRTPLLFVEEPAFELAGNGEKQPPVILKKASVSRWEASFILASEYNYRVVNFVSGTAANENEKNYFNNEKGIYSLAWSAFLLYSFSPHFSAEVGISHYTAGQERSESEVTLTNINAVNASANTYSVNTSVGSVSGDAQQFNSSYYVNADSSLFNPSGAPGFAFPQPASATKRFTFRQEFSFLDIPVLVQYRFSEHVITPYLGLGFSFGFMTSQKTFINEKQVRYESGNLHTFLFSSETKAGIQYLLNNHFSIDIQANLRYGLNAVNKSSETKWIPYAWGAGGGVSYRF